MQTGIGKTGNRHSADDRMETVLFLSKVLDAKRPHLSRL